MSGPPARFVLLAPALLVLTALVQIPLACWGKLAPWKGGGFGLFSTVDKLENRILLVWVETPTGDVPLAVQARDRQALDAIAFPTERSLARLAERFAADERPAGRALRLEVWKRTFDTATGECRRVKVASRAVPLVR